MTDIVFSGPTLSAEQVLDLADVEIRPPAQRGDVLKAALDGPRSIGLIDGYFTHAHSVWHKEILWALSRGIRVFGAASMGALRAAELRAFGIEGVGSIFEQFASGELTDDDEVAVVHAEKDLDYRPLSEAMVNIRATLVAAVAAGAIGESVARTLESIAKGLGYADRSYRLLLALGENQGLAAAELTALNAWLPAGQVNQKRADAKAMLRRMTSEIDQPRAAVAFEFSDTLPWRMLMRQALAEHRIAASVPATLAAAVLDELLLTGSVVEVYDAALARVMACGAAFTAAPAVDQHALVGTMEEFRREHGLSQPEAFETWLTRQALWDVEASEFFRREAQVRRVRSELAVHVHSALIDQLRSTGRYADLLVRARHKASLLEGQGMTSAELADTRLTEAELWEWYFASCHGIDVPDQLDAYARGQRTTIDRLLGAVIREHCYRRLQS